MENYTLGIDIGGTNFRIGTVSEKGEVTDFIKKSSEVFNNGNAIESLYEEIKNYLDEFQNVDLIKGVAIGLPSMVSKDKKTVYSTPNLKGFDDVYFGDTLSDKLGVPVFLDRDVNFLLQNDMERLELDKSKTILGFYVGTGFGNAIYMNNNFYCGKNGVAGELGHIPLFTDTKEVCTCGNYGCAELRCSGKHLEKIVENHFPNTPVNQVFVEHLHEDIVQRYVKELAIPIATEVNILDPDYIVLAGGVLFMENFPKDILTQSILQYTRKPYPTNNLEMFFSEHTQQSGVRGSGSYAHNRLAEMN